MLNPLSEEEEENRSLYSVIDKIRSDSGGTPVGVRKWVSSEQKW
jgi:hypothetical protein